jgi:hypothetical protein
MPCNGCHRDVIAADRLSTTALLRPTPIKRGAHGRHWHAARANAIANV